MSLAPHPKQEVDGIELLQARTTRYLPTLSREFERLREANTRLEATLAKVFEEVREFPDAPPESSDSYLPPHLVVEIAETLLEAGAVVRPDSHRAPFEPLVIYGPHGCGKTKHAAALARRFGMQRIVDDWNGTTPLQAGALALTSICPSEVKLYVDFAAGRYKAYPFDRVMVALEGFLESAGEEDRKPAGEQGA